MSDEKMIKVLCFPWPPGPGEVREVGRGIAPIQEQVRGSFEGHTLSNGCMVFCNEEGRGLFESEEHDPYLFPYVAMDLPGPEGPDMIRVHSFKSQEEMDAVPRVLAAIDVWGPCMIVGPSDAEGESTSVPEEAVAFLQQAFGACSRLREMDKRKK